MFVNVGESYSVYRSLRHGASSVALNTSILETIIYIYNKWRKDMRADGITISMSMLQRYTDAEVAVPT